ncbi:casein kinase 1, putative [Trypanosoma equiperdum]|uniref:non-specific serine/threonine protein kinase n=1 Tax=Trypanosoma equiperdum TaxID=5694 RepID=A0A1G4I8R9_TRYEQ|nr:casein kinase 1, putative [Trypanosoma equiperdum]
MAEATESPLQCSTNSLPHKSVSPFTPAASARHQVTVADGKITLLHRIGSGAFGELYVGVDKRSNKKLAVKLEKRNIAHPQLCYENKVYHLLHSGGGNALGIPRIYFYTTESTCNVLGMELCGPSLEDLFNYCGRRFTIKTVCMIAHQMINRIEFVHSKGIIHRDIKPENFVFGEGNRTHVLYIIDFGLSKPYWDRRRQVHIPFCEGKSITGTVRYCSSWTHKGYEQGRRDDMESIGFILVYFMSGTLPWQGTTVRDAAQKVAVIGEKKNATSVRELCNGLPNELLQYCAYCRRLGFTDRPDYDYLRGLFSQLARKQKGEQTPQSAASPILAPAAPQTLSPPAAPKNRTTTTSPEPNVSWAPDLGMDRTIVSEYDWMFDWFLKRRSEVSGVPWRSHSFRRQ